TSPCWLHPDPGATGPAALMRHCPAAGAALCTERWIWGCCQSVQRGRFGVCSDERQIWGLLSVSSERQIWGLL
uniref:Uncharacterized protein n=1 Tax=Cyanistes caeruleus TaxID=156563 RepID=A0A8C0VCW4_CYACU